MQNWLDKYKPSKVEDILGDPIIIKMIDEFIKQFYDEIPLKNIKNANLIITGINGIGKTLTIDLVLQKYHFDKVIPDLSGLSIKRKARRKKNAKAEKETQQGNRTVKNYYSTLGNNKIISFTGSLENRKIALIFDDVTSISNPKEKEAIKLIIKLNNKYKRFPIIIIGNSKHKKLMNELRKMITYPVKINDGGKKKNKKVTNEIIMRVPFYDQLEKFVKKICQKEGLNIKKNITDDDDDIYTVIIEHAQNDIRRLINILEELKVIYGNDEITLDKFREYCQTAKTKDIDPGIYEATRMLLNNYTNINDAISLYEEERATIPLMVHENYPLNIKVQYPKLSMKEKIDLVFEISKQISESDKIDGIIYSNQCWNLQAVHGFYSCVLPSYYANKYKNKLSHVEKYKYTQDYNKTSIKKINNKTIKKAKENQFLKKNGISDFLYMSSILKTLINSGKYEALATLMKPYKLSLKEIESIVKIDKIEKSKIVLTGRQRTKIRKLLGIATPIKQRKTAISKSADLDY